MPHNYRSRYLVAINNEQSTVNLQASPTAHVVNIYRYEKCNFEEASLVLKPSKVLSIFSEKSHICRMTEQSGACDRPDFDDNTIFVRSNARYNKYVSISVIEFIKFSTEDKFINFTSLMGNNMIPNAISLGEKYTSFVSEHYKFIENGRIEERSLLYSTDGSGVLYVYHLANCGVGAFKTIECIQIYTCYPEKEDDEEEDVWRAQRKMYAWVEEQKNLGQPTFCYGNNEMMKNFNQNCVICFKNSSVDAFRQRGHQCICEDCWTIKMLKY